MKKNNQRYQTLKDKRLDISKIKFIANCSLNESNREIKYFDENRKLVIAPIEKAHDIVPWIHRYSENSYVTLRIYPDFLDCRVDRNLFSQAVSKMQPGDDFDLFLHFCEEAKYDLSKSNWTFFERLVAKIDAPIFERETGNFTANTFDFVRVTVNLNRLGMSREEMVKKVREFSAEIYELVLQKIEDNRKFQKYGVPINCLRLSKSTLTKMDTLEVLMELKSMEKIPPKEEADDE